MIPDEKMFQLAAAGDISQVPVILSAASSETLLHTAETALNLHCPYDLFEDCGHSHSHLDDEDPDAGVREVDDIGLVCEDGFMYRICWGCYTGGTGDQTEECASSHHRPCWPCPTYTAVINALRDDQKTEADA